MGVYEYLSQRRSEGLQVVPERIVCAANKAQIGFVILGARHGDEIMINTAKAMKVNLLAAEQGFYTNWQRFVTRKEAMIIAKEQGQLFRPGGTHDQDILYSECLY